MSPAEARVWDLDDVVALLAELRAAGYRVGLDEHLAVQDLFLALAERGALPEDPARLGTLIGPVVCTSPAEQEDFARRFAAWRSRLALAPADVRAATTRKQELPPVVESGRRDRARATAFIAALLFATGVTVVALWAAPRYGNVTMLGGAIAPVPVAPPQTGLAPTSWPWWAWAAALAAAAILTARRFFRRQADAHLSRVAGAAASREHELFVASVGAALFAMPVPPAARRLRVHRLVGDGDLDVGRTVDATVRAGGWFTPVESTRPTLEGYVALVDRATHADHGARLADALLDRLEAASVPIARYWFSRDPRILQARDGRVLDLEELEALHGEDSLWVFGDGAGLISTASGRVAAWVTTLEAWSRRAVFSPAPPAEWGPRERMLREAGFLVLPATEEGMCGAAEDRSRRDSRSRAAEVAAAKPLPRALAVDSDRWLAPTPPTPAEIERLIREVAAYLEPDGYRWFCAVAVYPEVRWELTLYLGHTLHDARGQPVATPALAATLARLPWLRAGWMPDWLRERVLDDLPLRARAAVNEALEALLLTAIDRPAESFELKICEEDRGAARDIWASLLRRARKGDVARPDLCDRVFVTYTSSALAVRVPDAIRRFFRNSARAVSAPVAVRAPRETWARVATAGALGAAVAAVAALQLNTLNVARVNERFEVHAAQAARDEWLKSEGVHGIESMLTSGFTWPFALLAAVHLVISIAAANRWYRRKIPQTIGDAAALWGSFVAGMFVLGAFAPAFAFRPTGRDLGIVLGTVIVGTPLVAIITEGVARAAPWFRSPLSTLDAAMPDRIVAALARTAGPAVRSRWLLVAVAGQAIGALLMDDPALPFLRLFGGREPQTATTWWHEPALILVALAFTLRHAVLMARGLRRNLIVRALLDPMWALLPAINIAKAVTGSGHSEPGVRDYAINALAVVLACNAITWTITLSLRLSNPNSATRRGVAGFLTRTDRWMPDRWIGWLLRDRRTVSERRRYLALPRSTWSEEALACAAVGAAAAMVVAENRDAPFVVYSVAGAFALWISAAVSHETPRYATFAVRSMRIVGPAALSIVFSVGYAVAFLSLTSRSSVESMGGAPLTTGRIALVAAAGIGIAYTLWFVAFTRARSRLHPAERWLRQVRKTDALLPFRVLAPLRREPTWASSTEPRPPFLLSAFAALVAGGIIVAGRLMPSQWLRDAMMIPTICYMLIAVPLSTGRWGGPFARWRAAAYIDILFVPIAIDAVFRDKEPPMTFVGILVAYAAIIGAFVSLASSAHRRRHPLARVLGFIERLATWFVLDGLVWHIVAALRRPATPRPAATTTPSGNVPIAPPPAA